MGLMGWIFYFILGLLFFFIISVLERKFHISRLEKLVFSLILLMISAGICFCYAIKYTDNIFLSFVFLMIIDVIYNSYFVERDFFDRNEGNISYYILLIIFGFFINQEFFNKVQQVFLTGEDLRIVLWFLVFAFLYFFSKEKNVFSKVSIEKKSFMSKDSVLSDYAKLKYKYYDECDYGNKELSNVIYAIMIFENRRRSKLLRNYDYFMFRISGTSRKLGIMQVESKKFITDVDSIEIVHQKIEKLLGKKTTKKTKISYPDVIKLYDKKNFEEIQYIFEIIKKF